MHTAMGYTPDIVMAGLSLWIRKRTHLNSNNYWDGNWLDISACATAPGARVEIAGALLCSSDIARFLAQLETLYRDLSGTAKLGDDEPTIMAEMACDRLGHIKLTVNITPDLVTQAHRFYFDLDQSHLPAIMADCQRAMERFPIKGSPHA